MWEDLRQIMAVPTGNRCRKCGGEPRSTDFGYIEIEREYIMVGLQCNECGHGWDAVYSYSHKGANKED